MGRNPTVIIIVVVMSGAWCRVGFDQGLRDAIGVSSVVVQSIRVSPLHRRVAITVVRD